MAMAMAKFPISARRARVKCARAARRGLSSIAAWASIASLAGCAVVLQDTPGAREPELRSRPPSAVYSGWRVFEDKCALCHGSDATGKAGAPDLLPKVRGIGARQFADVLLTRYEWTVPPAQSAKTTPEREAFIDDLLQRRKGAIAIPEGQGEPRVNAHVIDLYAYLSARAEGTQGTGRPAR